MACCSPQNRAQRGLARRESQAKSFVLRDKESREQRPKGLARADVVKFEEIGAEGRGSWHSPDHQDLIARGSQTPSKQRRFRLLDQAFEVAGRRAHQQRLKAPEQIEGMIDLLASCDSNHAGFWPFCSDPMRRAAGRCQDDVKRVG